MHRATDLPKLAAAIFQPWFAHGGQAGHRLEHLDWSMTAMGVPATWSPRLHAVLEVCLESHVPMAICWQRELTVLHNDAYQPLLGPQSAALQGQRARTIYADTWHLLKDAFLTVMTDGRAVQVDDRHMPAAFRIPYPPRPVTYHFSPIRSGRGHVEGTCIIATGLSSPAPPGVVSRWP